MSRLGLLALQVLVGLAMLAIWHVGATVKIGGTLLLPPFFFSTPGDVIARVVQMFASGKIWGHLWITLVENNENPITDRKNSTSRESKTPFWNPSKCVITLKEVTKSTSVGLAQPSRKRTTGAKPHRIRKKQTTTEMMKLTTWVRVMADVMQLMARYAPAINQLPM